MPPEAEAEFRAIVSDAQHAIAGYWINRRFMFMGKWLRHAYYPNWNLRLFKHRLGHHEKLTDVDTQTIQAKRRELWQRYHGELAGWCSRNGVSQPVVPEHCEQAWHMYYLLLPSLEKRHALISHLKERGVHAVFHYLPLHLSDHARRWGDKIGDCPVTEDVSDRLLRLPFYNSMTAEQQGRVIEAIREFSA